MKTQEFITKLKEHNSASLLFEYSKGNFAGANYHLTEIKNVTFETVDCGGNANNWKETHIQLWESPNEIGKEDYMTVNKANAIIERVNNINPLWQDTEIKVEFGNETFHTSILDISGFEYNAKKNQLIAQLFSVKTGCKASDVCGVVVEKEEETACCAPTNGSGCC